MTAGSPLRGRLLRDDLGSKAWVPFAKGVAILLVVLYHTMIYFGSLEVWGLPGRLKVVLELFPMPVFMLLAGLFAPRMLQWTFTEIWRRRLLPIGYLYVLWSLLRFAFFFALPALNFYIGEGSSRDPWVLLQIVTGPANIYWFLYALLIFTVVGWLLRRVPPLVQIVPAALVSALVTSGWISSGTVVWDRVGGLLVFYLVGLHYAKPITAIVGGRTGWSAAGLIAASALVAGSLYLSGVAQIPFAVTIAQSLAVLGGLVACKFLVRLRPLSFVSDAGDKSLQIYVLHLFVVSVITWVLSLFAQPDWPTIVDVVTLFSGTAIVVVVTLWIIRLTSRWKWLYIPPSRWLTGRSRGASSAADRKDRA